MVKQMQKLQAEMARVQAELGEKRVEASAGGGVVRAIANGQQELVAIEIDPEAVSGGDVEFLQDLILAACNEALRKSRELASAEMARLTGGLNLPGLPGL